MKLGIAGFGKMGQDIFNLLFDKFREDRFVILEPYNTEKHAANLQKQLDRKHRRGLLTEQQLADRKQAVTFTADPGEFAGCDLVLEAIPEALAAKQALFARLTQIVPADCLLLTNTSSLPVADIFAPVQDLSRCSGMHFFYPVRLTGFVELNLLPETSAKTAEAVAALVQRIGKEPLPLEGAYHMYLNQILSCAVAHGFVLLEQYGVSPAQLDKALSGLMPTAPVFEILDSVGVGLMGADPGRFRIPRNAGLLAYGHTAMKQLLDAGCSPAPLSFLDYAAAHMPDTSGDASRATADMTALLLNEMARALGEYNGDRALFARALQETLGLAQTPKELYQAYGAETLSAVLDRFYQTTGFASYQPAGAQVWDTIFSEV